MKNKERAERLYAGLTEVDDRLIQEADKTPILASRKPAAWVKWSAAAACFAAAVLSAALYLAHTAENPSGPISAAGSEHTSKPSAPESQEEAPDRNHLPVTDGEIWGAPHANGAFADPEKQPPALSEKPNLEGFRFAKHPDSYDAPQNGAYVMTDSLQAAVEKYGDQVTYRIHLTLYKDRKKLDSGSAEAQGWFAALSPDITVSYWDYQDGTAHFCDFYLDACSYDDLTAFCREKSDYGVLLSLYSEANGDFSESTKKSPPIYNLPDLNP